VDRQPQGLRPPVSGLKTIRSADGSKLPEFVEISTFAPKAAQNLAAILKLVVA
jgi:hypothetical protein